LGHVGVCQAGFPQGKNSLPGLWGGVAMQRILGLRSPDFFGTCPLSPPVSRRHQPRLGTNQGVGSRFGRRPTPLVAVAVAFRSWYDRCTQPVRLHPEEPRMSVASPESGRIASLDQFRGYTVLGMFFVNFIGHFAVIAALAPVVKHHNTYCSYADTIMP